MVVTIVCRDTVVWRDTIVLCNGAQEVDCTLKEEEEEEDSLKPMDSFGMW